MRRSKRKPSNYVLNSTDVSFQSLASHNRRNSSQNLPKKRNQSHSNPRRNRTYVSKRIFSIEQKSTVTSIQLILYSKNMHKKVRDLKQEIRENSKELQREKKLHNILKDKLMKLTDHYGNKVRFMNNIEVRSFTFFIFVL